MKRLRELLAAYESRYQAGDKSALFDAVTHCAAHQLPIPENEPAKR